MSLFDCDGERVPKFVPADQIPWLQTFAATVRSDAQAIAADAKNSVSRVSGDKARVRSTPHVALASAGKQAADRLLTVPLHVQGGGKDVEFSEDVLCFVQSLTYASFDDNDTASEGDSKALEPWQVEHATAMLQQSPELEHLRFALCPKCAPPLTPCAPPAAQHRHCETLGSSAGA